MDSTTLITNSARAVTALAPALVNMEQADDELADARTAIERGHFTPQEEHRVRAWFARYLTVRAGLLETIDDLRPMARRQMPGISEHEQLRAFVVAFTAACLLIRAARFLVEDFATQKVIQRKLNEADVSFRIPRRQYTKIYRSLTGPVNALALIDAMRFAEEQRHPIDALADDPLMGPVVQHLRNAEAAVDVDLSRYVKARLRYRWHSWRRRQARAVEEALFAVLEGAGRVIADIHNPWHRNRLTKRKRRKLVALLEPGDVLVTRHDDAFSNLFLPGYWPHASLHVGLPGVRERLAIEVAPERAARWVDPRRVLEARKDGVLFRVIDDTFAVDAVAVLRPTLPQEDIARAISNAVQHEGKLYNFDYDFFADDRIVCTEVVYRAYEGVGGVKFTLSEMYGRVTLTAEDIITMALEDRGFRPVATFGTPGTGRRIVTGDDALKALRRLRDASD